jgi:uncharacterized membrane protein
VAIVSIDCLILVIGCMGLALAFPPLIYAAALGHLIAGFMLAIGKWFWAISTLVITAAATVLLAGGEYLVQVLYRGTPADVAAAAMQSDWPRVIAVAIVAAGIAGALTSYPGVLDQIREDRDHVTRT